MGTNIIRVNEAEAKNPLSGNLSGFPTRDGWLALANAAQALLQIAQAALGETVATTAHLSPTPTLVCHPATTSTFTVAEGVNTFLIAKARAGKSDRYIKALKNSLSKFVRGRARVLLDHVTAEHLEIWLAESDWAPGTQDGYLSDVRIFYNFAKLRGWCSTNPAAQVEIDVEDRLIEVHTPAQVRVVMDTAREMNLDVMRCMALRYFGGLRAIEAEKQSEDDIHREENFLKVTSAKRNTRARRPVTILPVLHAWLDVGGSLPLVNSGHKMAALVKALEAKGVPWPQNSPRHSFCSYHLSMFENAAKTAREAGHSEQMLFKRYNGEVLKKDASLFWAIMPN